MTCCSSSCKRSLLSSTIALKAQMAVTGLILYGFVVMHMVGNLKAFGGEINGVPMLDIYARYLREMGEHLFGHGGVLWGVRIVLLLSLLLHVEAAVKLKSRNLESKPIKYRIFDYRASTVAARTMLVGGVFLFFFVIFHILHFTTGHLYFGRFVEGGVYSNVYRAFQHFSLVAIYVVAVFFLGLHLYHGVWSAFQTLGINSPSCNRCFKGLAAISGVVIFVGFAAVPLACYMGVLAPPHP